MSNDLLPTVPACRSILTLGRGNLKSAPRYSRFAHDRVSASVGGETPVSLIAAISCQRSIPTRGQVLHSQRDRSLRLSFATCGPIHQVRGETAVPHPDQPVLCNGSGRRVGGETTDELEHAARPGLGLSTRARGSWRDGRVASGAGAKVYPRVGGETSADSNLPSLLAAQGSIPAWAGKPRRVADSRHRFAVGSIPAWAGKPCQSAVLVPRLRTNRSIPAWAGKPHL